MRIVGPAVSARAGFSAGMPDIRALLKALFLQVCQTIKSRQDRNRCSPSPQTSKSVTLRVYHDDEQKNPARRELITGPRHLDPVAIDGCGEALQLHVPFGVEARNSPAARPRMFFPELWIPRHQNET